MTKRIMGEGRSSDTDGASDVRDPEVVIVGGGFGGLRAARTLGSQPVRVTLVDRLNYHLFQPLLYQVALAGLTGPDVAVPIRSILRRHNNVRVIMGDVVGVAPEQKRIRLADGSTKTYDYLILAAGAGTHYYGNDNWASMAPGLKDLNDALEIRRRVLSALEAAEVELDPERRAKLLTFVVIGGGPTGVELAGAIADLSRDIIDRDFHCIGPEDVHVVLLEMADRILTPFEPDQSEKAKRQLQELRVEVRTGIRVTRIDREGVWLGETLLPSATILWAAGVKPSPLGRGLGVPLDRGGRVIVERDCSLPGHPEIFVVGDMASFTPPGGDRPLPGISPVAIQQGRAAALNILRDLDGRPRETFQYRDKGFMATIGRARAVARIGRLKLTGFIAWLAWAVVHLWYLVGFRNRLAVFVNWIWSYLMTRHGARIITGPTPDTPRTLSPQETVDEAATPSAPPGGRRPEEPRRSPPHH